MVRKTTGDIISLSMKAAMAAGDLIKNSKPLKVTTKCVSDYVTEIDVECQRIIKEIINQKYPEHNFLAEEDGGEFIDKNDLWIIDPLDGTTNFIHGLSHSAVSIAFYTACGRFDCFFEGWLSPWDLAAGVLILTESGGKACDFRGENNYLKNGSIIGAGKNIFGPFFKEINSYLEDSV